MRIGLLACAFMAALVAVFGLWLRLVGGPGDRPLIGLIPERGTDLRLAVFGSSLTAVYDWPEVLAERLASCLGHPVALIRVALPGANSSWALDHVDEVILAKPDLVVMEFAINDADIKDWIAPWTSRAQHAELLTRLQSELPDTRIVLLTMNPVHGKRAVFRAGLALYYRALGGLADRFGTGLGDVYSQWKSQRRSSWGFPDGLHPELAAARDMIVPVLSAIILRALPVARQGTCKS